jgi:hypothetical protein
MLAKRLLADAIFIVHAALFPLVLFGWAISSIWPIYIYLLIATLLSDLVFGYCILSKWEFDLRKQVDPQINYNCTWAGYYVHRLFTNAYLSDVFWKRVSIFFLVGSLAISIYFHYFY